LTIDQLKISAGCNRPRLVQLQLFLQTSAPKPRSNPVEEEDSGHALPILLHPKFDTFSNIAVGSKLEVWQQSSPTSISTLTTHFSMVLRRR